LAKTEYANADINALHSAKELPLVIERKRKLLMVVGNRKKRGVARVTSPQKDGLFKHV